MLLSEVLHTVVPWSWTERAADYYEAQFFIDKWLYTVKIVRYITEKRWLRKPDSFWVFEYQLSNPPEGKDKHDITGTGNAITVISTVSDILNQFVNKVKPNIIKFEAKEPSRLKLYSRLLTTARIPNMKIKHEQRDGSNIIELVFDHGR